MFIIGLSVWKRSQFLTLILPVETRTWRHESNYGQYISLLNSLQRKSIFYIFFYAQDSLSWSWHLVNRYIFPRNELSLACTLNISRILVKLFQFLEDQLWCIDPILGLDHLGTNIKLTCLKRYYFLEFTINSNNKSQVLMCTTCYLVNTEHPASLNFW